MNAILSTSVVSQMYEVDVFKENVILGNDALMKCSIPSFVAESVQVVSWHDSEGGEFRDHNGKEYVQGPLLE